MVEDAVGHPPGCFGEPAERVLPGAPDQLDDIALLGLNSAEVEEDRVETYGTDAAPVLPVDEYARFVRHLAGDAVVEADMDGADGHVLWGDELAPLSIWKCLAGSV